MTVADLIAKLAIQEQNAPVCWFDEHKLRYLELDDVRCFVEQYHTSDGKIKEGKFTYLGG